MGKLLRNDDLGKLFEATKLIEHPYFLHTVKPVPHCIRVCLSMWAFMFVCLCAQGGAIKGLKVKPCSVPL